jgi:hypothetical protein
MKILGFWFGQILWIVDSVCEGSLNDYIIAGVAVVVDPLGLYLESRI